MVNNTFLGLRSSKKNSEEYKGFIKKEAIDLSLNNDQILQNYCINSFSTNSNPNNIEIIDSIIYDLRKKDIRVIVVTLPYADRSIWEYSNWDSFNNQTKELKDRLNIPYFDFNLLRTRYSLFNDSESFVDTDHLSESGAKAFTNAFCEIIKKLDAGEDVSDLFYDSYEEMKQDSPYMEYYLAHKDEQ